MAAAKPARLLSLSLFLKAAVVFHPHLLVEFTAARRDISSSSPITSSYQPSSSSAEGRWIAEEEFHGASSLLSTTDAASERLKRKKSKHAAVNNRHERLNEEDPSWWDDEEDAVDNDNHEGSDSGIGCDDEEYLGNTATNSPSTISIEEGAASKREKGLRKRLWKKNRHGHGNKSDESSSISSSGGIHPAEVSQSKTESQPSSSSSSSEYDEEHPMRTDEWLLNIRLSRFYPIEEGDYFPECNNFMTTPTSSTQERDIGSRRTKRQVMQFARNGYVKILLDDDERIGSDDTRVLGGIKRKYKARVGKWRIGHSGVAFDIPIQMQVANTGNSGKQKQQLLPSIHAGGGDRLEDIEPPRVTASTTTTTVLHYHADIHLNKFGERPRMFRGVITRDRTGSSFLPPNFLRPVIGTFSAEGIGHDTADTSYRDRAISLSRQQVINEAKGMR